MADSGTSLELVKYIKYESQNSKICIQIKFKPGGKVRPWVCVLKDVGEMVTA